MSQPHAHPHPHPHPHPQQGPPPGAQSIQVQAPDPAIVAAIDAQYTPVALQVGGENNNIVTCGPHNLEVCNECGTNFFFLNQTAKVLASFPKEMPVPPPPNVVHPQRTPLVQKAKEEGNQLFKRGKHIESIQKYDMAAGIAVSRFPWEAAALVRDEVAVVICNRSAAFFAAGDFVSALVDADAVIQLKRPWSKGHFRKAKALLGMGRLADARESAELGLQFETDSKELSSFVAEIDALIAKKNESP
ncbi:hypothetical protein DL93DRAFT_2084855 [Clavulina sp. PMI_390]|nr:hypothetical protein DL93DRAFT_2084855 [Clavulina sp. PMI_390]